MLGKFTITFKKEIPTILIHTDSDYIFEGEEKFNLILTPAFYWCKKERVGVKNLSAAKAIARSVFDANIPEGEYKYLVKKSDLPGEFLFFAYDEDAIVEKLHALGVPMNRIAAIYLAQNELATIEEPIRLSDKTALILADGIVSAMPARFVPEAKPLDTEKIPLSRNKIPIRTYNSLGIKASRIYTLTAASALFAVIFFFENRYYTTALDEEGNRQSAMLKAADLPTTSFQLESIKKTLLKRANETKELKTSVASLLSIAKESDSPIDSLQITAKEIKATYRSKNSKSLQAMLQKSHPKAKVAQKEASLSVELTR